MSALKEQLRSQVTATPAISVSWDQSLPLRRHVLKELIDMLREELTEQAVESALQVTTALMKR